MNRTKALNAERRTLYGFSASNAHPSAVRIKECMDTYGWNLLDSDDKSKILKGLSLGKVLRPPRMIDLEWSRRCWLPDATRGRCPGLAAHEMDLYTLEMLFEEMEDAGVRALVLGGAGDPLEHRSIESLLKHLSRVPFRLCSLATGGTALKGRTAELLASVLRGRLEVRLETEGGAGEADGCRLRTVAENLRVWRKLRPAGAAYRTVVRMVITPGNCGRIRAMAEAACAMGADGVAFAAMRSGGLALAFLEQRKTLMESARAAFEADTEGRIESIEPPHPQMAEELHELRAAFPDRYPEASPLETVGDLFRTACVMPWLGLAVDPNGDAHACRRAAERGAAPVGNIHARPLERLWGDRPMRALRLESRAVRWSGRSCAACRAGEEPLIPYASDRDFCQELDSLLRGGAERSVRFPERLRDREWSTVVLPLRRLWPWGAGGSPQVRVDGVPVGAAAGGDGTIAIRFRPDGLRQGFHLLEVVDRTGRLLKARVVEKVR